MCPKLKEIIQDRIPLAFMALSEVFCLVTKDISGGIDQHR